MRSVPGVELDGWRPEVSECDHCGTTRRRSATYLVEHEDGSRKQVGSSCMADFLGASGHPRLAGSAQGSRSA